MLQQRKMTCPKGFIIEEPCEGKLSCTVLKTSFGGDSNSEFNSAYLQQREEWKLEGQLEGKEEGRRSEIKLITRLLSRHLGEVNPQISQKIQELSFEQLENLGEALLDFNSESDLANWLENN